MAPFSQQFSASASPVLTLAPHAVHHQVTPGLRPLSHQVVSTFGYSPSHAQLGSSWQSVYSQTRGRKRSRDEAAINLDSSSSSDTPVKQPQNPFGSSLAHSQTSSAIAPVAFGTTPTPSMPVAPSQPHAMSAKQEDRPTLRSHKSQRLDQAAIAQQQTTSGMSSIAQSGLPEASSNPIVDDFTMHLGIGWRRISEDVDIQAAARGWARYIENNYPVTSAKICLESKGLQSYLVEAAEGFFLFSENLREGRLVSRNVEGALCNLKGQTPIFEGVKMIVGQSTEVINPIVPQRHGAVVGHADVEMDI